jgi:hypothetical protein
MLKLKPRNIERHITEWLAANGHDELVAWARVAQVQVGGGYAPGTFVSMEASSASPRWAKEAMGFDDRENALILGYRHAFVLTRSRFFVLMLTLFKERPKRLWVEAPAANATLYHLDARAQRGHLVRYLALDLPDGRLAPNDKPATFVLDSFVLESKRGKRSPLADLSDAFIAAFGDRAHRVEPPTP